MTNPVKQALANVIDSLNSRNYDEEQLVKVKEALMQLFIFVMKADGDVSDSEVEMVSGYFKENYGQNAVTRFRTLLGAKDNIDVDASCESLKDFNVAEREKIVEALVNLAYSDGQYLDEEKAAISQIAESLRLIQRLLI